MRTSRRTTGIWMGPEWYVGQDVQEVNEMWERDKVAGWWTGRRAAGGGDRTEVGDYRARVEAWVKMVIAPTAR